MSGLILAGLCRGDLAGIVRLAGSAAVLGKRSPADEADADQEEDGPQGLGMSRHRHRPVFSAVKTAFEGHCPEATISHLGRFSQVRRQQNEVKDR